jgi:hypothetical protein
VRRPLRRAGNARRSFRPLFVAGASGSGTSYLAVSLGQRFACAGVAYEADIEIDEGSFLHVPALDSFASVAEYQRHMTPAADWSVDQARADLQGLFRSLCDGPGDRVVSKAPDSNQLRAAFLDRCFPDAQWVLVFRDPVANVEGFRRKWKVFGEDRLEEAIRFWREIHERFLEAASGWGDRVIAIEYEALVESPDASFAEIGSRLGLDPAPRRRRLASRPDAEGMLGLRNVKGGEIQVVTDSNRRARERLDPADAEAIERALDPVRERLRAAPFTLRPEGSARA